MGGHEGVKSLASQVCEGAEVCTADGRPAGRDEARRRFCLAASLIFAHTFRSASWYFRSLNLSEMPGSGGSRL